MVGAEIIKQGYNTTIVRGKKLCLLRIGDAPPKDVADEAKRVMIKLWNNAIGKPVTDREARCLWGMSKDMMKLLAEAGLPAEQGGELAIAVFKYALGDWTAVASALKLAAEARPKYKPRFYDYPCIPHLRSFYQAAVHAYVSFLQMEKAKPPAGLEFLAQSKVSGKIQALTDPMADHPGVTPEIEKALDGGYAVLAAKAK